MPFEAQILYMKTPRWHRTMYDRWYIQDQLDSKFFRDAARLEAKFILQQLGLKPGSQILDVPCGAGRHASEFAKLGYRVTAIDINRECLKFAQKNCKGLGVTLQQGDMKDLSQFRSQFDGVTNLFTSFGYFDTDEENEEVLQQLISILKPGGKIALQLVNRDWLLKVFRPVGWRQKGATLELEARQYDPKTKYIESFLVVVRGYPKTCEGRDLSHDALV
jgi:2-polyprenyl-3-methyl-5-hydroxy-6-metoxy-1,4-benzoquinol methylase